MLVVVPTNGRGDMMFIVVHNMVLTSSNESYLWLLFPFYDLGSHHDYPRGVQMSH